MAGFGSFLKGAADYQLEQNKKMEEQRMYEKKLQLAQDMAMKLEQRKMEMAKQYPTYGRIMQTSSGAIIGFDQYGGQKELRQADPEIRQSLLDQRNAKSAEDKARAAYAQAQEAFLREKMKDPQKFMQQPRERPDPTILTGGQTVKDYDSFLKANGTMIDDGSGTGKMIVRPADDTPEMREAWRNSRKDLGVKVPGTSLVMPQSQEDYDPDDFSNPFLSDD